MDDNEELSPWMRLYFDEHQIKEINFDRIYAEAFHHGTDGHNMRMIIAKMAELLDLHYQTSKSTD